MEDTQSSSSYSGKIKEEPELGAIHLMRMILSGQYTYLTYMILSTTCFFFWLMPNCHKIRSLFSFTAKTNFDQRARRYKKNDTNLILEK
jgi:hypothetical protein